MVGRKVEAKPRLQDTLHIVICMRRHLRRPRLRSTRSSAGCDVVGREHPRIRSFVAGVVGAAVMALVIWKEGHFATRVIEEFPQWNVALGAHLLIGGGFGLVYGYAFDAVHRTGWRVGMALGALHGILAVIVLSIAPSGHALYQVGQPSWAGAAFIVGIHVLFGWMMGVLVEPRAPLPERETTREEVGASTRSPVS
jgi:hypothetical protein